MTTRIFNRLKGLQKGFLLFIFANIFLGFAASIEGSVLSNFLKEKLNFVIMQRTTLEIPRELPGFLVFLITGLLFRLGAIRMSIIANILAAVGLTALGIVEPKFAYILFFIFIYSMGIHLYMPLSNSITMDFARDGNFGRKLGIVGAANTAAMVAGSAVLYVLFKYMDISYTVSFAIGGAAFLLSSTMFIFINKKGKAPRVKTRFVFRKEYRLFYVLSALYGARKQIFITFVPWVLVDVFSQKVTSMTMLFFVSSVISIFVKPFFGNMIDRKGERFVLTFDAVGLFIICFGYAFAKDVFQTGGALIVIFVCYILDSSFLASNMARSTYIKKIAVREEDVLPVLSSGISIDHIFSMFLPFMGGILWTSFGTYGYKYVFMAGALIALANLVATRFVKTAVPPNDDGHAGTGDGGGDAAMNSAGMEVEA